MTVKSRREKLFFFLKQNGGLRVLLVRINRMVEPHKCLTKRERKKIKDVQLILLYEILQNVQRENKLSESL